MRIQLMTGDEGWATATKKGERNFSEKKKEHFSIIKSSYLFVVIFLSRKIKRYP